ASAAVATFASKDVGTGIAVTVTGLTLAGAQSNDYTLLAQPSGLAANITPFGLTVTGVTANNKVYDATKAGTLNTANAALVTPFGGDSVTLDASAAVATFAQKDVGTGLSVTVTGLGLAGAQSNDYTLAQPSGLIANI